jgi:hypothetical protein
VELLLKQTLQILTEHQKRDTELALKAENEKKKEEKRQKHQAKWREKQFSKIESFTAMFRRSRERLPNIDEIKQYFITNPEYGINANLVDEYFMNHWV